VVCIHSFSHDLNYTCTPNGKVYSFQSSLHISLDFTFSFLFFIRGVDLGDVYIASLASSLLGSSAAPGFPNLFRADTTTLGSSCLDIPAEDTMTTAAGTAGVDMETGEGREVQREGKKVGNEGHISSVQERSFEAELDAARQVRCEVHICFPKSSVW